MFWYKSWADTRSRFLIGLVLLSCAAIAAVLTYPEVMKLMPVARTMEANGVIGQKIREAVELQATFRGFVFSQWFGQSALQMWTLFAILIGSGGLFSQTFGGGTLFTLSLPATRNQILGVRALVGLGELLLLALVPSLLIPVTSPAIGETYSIADALVHGACLFTAGALFFSLALFLSTVFQDLWRPLLLALGIAVALSVIGTVVRLTSGTDISIYSVMSAESYFRNGALPWFGLLASATLSAAMLYGASVNVASQDF